MAHKTTSISTNKRLVMIMGVQRSGTTGLFYCLSRHPSVTGYHEDEPRLYTPDYMLKPASEIRDILDASPGIIVLKPISETMRRTIYDVASEFSDYDLRIVWIYRDPVNVIYSWLQMGWSTPEQIDYLANQWNIRNQLFLDYQMAPLTPTIVVRYEDLCNNIGLVSELGARLGIQYVSTMESDSAAGRARFDKSFQDRIDDQTAVMLAQLDSIRTLKPCANDSIDETTSCNDCKSSLFGKDPFATTYPWRNQRFDMSHVHGQFFRMSNIASHILLPAQPENKAAAPDIFTAEFNQYPHELMKTWRSFAPITRLPGQGAWLLHDAETVGAAFDSPDLYDYFTPTIPESDCSQRLDQDNHRKLNIPRADGVRNSWINGATGELLAARADTGRFDLHNDVTNVLWVLVYHEWLGVKMESIQDAYFSMQVESRPKCMSQWMSGSGVLADIVRSEPELPEETVARFNLLFNSPGTIMDGAGCVIVELLRHPEWLAYARANPDEISAIVTEILRLYPPVIIIRKRVARDTSLCGSDLKNGDTLFLAVAAANRDARIYEAPDDFMPGRVMGVANFAFGGGRTKCPAETLATSDITSIVRAVITHEPHLEAAGDIGSVTYSGGPYLHIPNVIPVRIGNHG